MNRTTLSALLGLALAAAPVAHAAETPLSYTYVEVNYLDTELDVTPGVTLSMNGGGINGSLAFGDSGFFGLAGYEAVGEEIAGVDLDVKRATLGAGYALKIDERLHAIGEVAYVDYDFDAAGLDAGADGYRVNIGLRGLMADNIEGIAKIGYVKVEESGVEIYDGAVGELGFRWYIDNAWSAGLSTEIADDETTYKLGLRLQW
jgi:hypothetical protein